MESKDKNPAREAQRQAFDKWIKEVAGVPSEYNRMYGHHLTSFMAGCDWAGDSNLALQKRVEELEAALKSTIPMAIIGAERAAGNSRPEEYHNHLDELMVVIQKAQKLLTTKP